MFPVLQLKPKKERSIINRHPWIFSGAIATLPKAESGDIVKIVSHEKKTLGLGFYSPGSQITCRMFHFGDDELVPDHSYWQNKINDAFELRKSVINFENTNTYRLIHAEGDFFPGIIADVYDKIVVIQILIRGTEKLLPVIRDCFGHLGFNHIYMKNKSSSQRMEQVTHPNGWLGEGVPLPVVVLENGNKFYVDPEKGQKTGFFIDQRENRLMTGNWAQGKKVLNAFSYSGGFSIYALAGGATMVDSVDISKDAIDLCNNNAELNGFAANHRGFAEDCFDYIKKTEVDYDVIILDPPAFAKNARSVPNASRGYKELNLSAFKKIKKNGLVFTFSCSQNISKELFQKIVFSAAADARRNVRIIRHLSQPSDHPINIFHPESEYLKGLLLWVS